MIFTQPVNDVPGKFSTGSLLAMLATIAGVLFPLIPVQYQIAAQATIAGLGAAATVVH